MIKKIAVVLCILILAGSGIYWFALRQNAEENKSNEAATSEPLHTIENIERTKFKVFTAQEFSDLYNGFAYPNTQPIKNDFSITDSVEADNIINNLAEDTGYRIRSAPVTNNFVGVDKDQQLQRLAAESWKDLDKAARKNDIELRVTQGYRSAEDQNKIFISRLGGINTGNIINGSSNGKITEILKTTAPPGYSRHHSGYTIDLACNSDPGVLFENSNCFEWISDNNYINVKKFGWIPSYPEGIKNQGPEPESWEYVWVGTDALKE